MILNAIFYRILSTPGLVGAIIVWAVSYIGIMIAALKRTINITTLHDLGWTIGDIYIENPVGVNDLMNHWLFNSIDGYP